MLLITEEKDLCMYIWVFTIIIQSSKWFYRSRPTYDIYDLSKAGTCYIGLR